MARIRIGFPENFPFSTEIPIRITDLNYGGHVGNDTILSLIHEARIQFLRHYGYGETDMAGTGLIMSDAVVNYKRESFHGDVLRFSIAATNFTRISFDVVYLIQRNNAVVAEAKTGMVCFDYKTRAVTPLPAEVRNKLST
jgi:acyl-CoA thioester hydrolase